MWGRCDKIQQIHECVNIMAENENKQDELGGVSSEIIVSNLKPSDAENVHKYVSSTSKVYSDSREKLKRSKYFYPIVLLSQKIGFIVFFILHKLFVRLEVKGQEYLKGVKGPVIIAPNHTGELDVTVIPQIFGLFSRFYPIYYATNPDEKYERVYGSSWQKYLFGGILFEVFGGIPIYLGYKSYAISLKKHIELLKKGETICIFCEGMITTDGKMNKPRGGVGYMIHTTSPTIIPVAIDTFYNLSMKDYFLRRRKVIVTICKPMYKSDLINTDNPGLDDFRGASQKILDVISENLRK